MKLICTHHTHIKSEMLWRTVNSAIVMLILILICHTINKMLDHRQQQVASAQYKHDLEGVQASAINVDVERVASLSVMLRASKSGRRP